ncbi:hypothetical protein TSOC_011760, partial [Tetrabaena socialis]
DLVAFYEQHAVPSNATACVLCCEVWGAGAADAPPLAPAPPAEAAVDAAAAAWQHVGPEDLGALHRALPHYCHSATLGVMRPLGAAAAQGGGQ